MNRLLGNKCVWETDKGKWRNTVKLFPGAGEVAKLFFIKNKVKVPATEGAVRKLSVTLVYIWTLKQLWTESRNFNPDTPDSQCNIATVNEMVWHEIDSLFLAQSCFPGRPVWSLVDLIFLLWPRTQLCLFNDMWKYRALHCCDWTQNGLKV